VTGVLRGLLGALILGGCGVARQDDTSPSQDTDTDTDTDAVADACVVVMDVDNEVDGVLDMTETRTYADSRLLSIDKAVGASGYPDSSITFGYDVDGRWTTADQVATDGTIMVHRDLLYDGDGRHVEDDVDYGGDGRDVDVHVYVYDSDDRIAWWGMDLDENGDPRQEAAYTYGNDGNVATVTFTNGNSTELLTYLAYDADGHPLEWQVDIDGTLVSTTASYDAHGNEAREDVDDFADGQIDRSTAYIGTYDADDNVVEYLIDSDADGTDDLSWTYTYSAGCGPGFTSPWWTDGLAPGP
jgi:hypothetical protein